MLLKYGLEKADREEAQVFLAASPMGERVYRRLEFEEVGKMEIDLESFGGEGVHCHRELKIDGRWRFY